MTRGRRTGRPLLLPAVVLALVLPSLLLWTAGPAAAQAPAALVPQGSPLPRALPLPAPDVAPGLRTDQPAASALAGSTQLVRVDSVSIAGATAYGAAELGALTEGLVGPAVPLAHIEAAREALLSRYRADGFALTTVSATRDAAGRLGFVVVEGRIAEVKLDGDIGPAGTQVLRFLNRLLEERPISVATLERYLLLASDVPGVTLRSVLRPSAEEPGALTLVAQVSRRAFGGPLGADNRAFRSTGPEQLLAIGTFNSFTQFGERTELSLLHSFNNTQTFGQAATEAFVGSSGLRIRLYAGQGAVNPSDILREIGYDGSTRVFGIQASYPVIRRRQHTLTAVAAFDAIESDIRTNFSTPGVGAAGGPSARQSFDSLRVARLGVDYALQDVLLGADRTAISTASLRLSQGIGGFGASRRGDPQAGRAGQQPQFFKVVAELTRTQTLFRPWDGASVDLFGLLAGQASPDVLPSAEKYFLGGIRTNRGFYAGEATGDNALTTTLELRLNTGTQFEAFGRPLDIGAQFYVFHDWGQTWENQRVDPNRRLQSVGGGVRAQLTQYTEFDLEGVARLTRRPQGGSAGSVSALKGEAVYWRVLTRF